MCLPLGSFSFLGLLLSQTHVQSSQSSLMSHVLWWGSLLWLGCVAKPFHFAQAWCICFAVRMYLTPGELGLDFDSAVVSPCRSLGTGALTALSSFPPPHMMTYWLVYVHMGVFPFVLCFFRTPLPSWLHWKTHGRDCSKGFIRWAVELFSQAQMWGQQDVLENHSSYWCANIMQKLWRCPRGGQFSQVESALKTC